MRNHFFKRPKKCLQISNLRAMLMPDAAAGAMVEFGEPTEFHNWAGKGAEDLILPDIKENSDDSDASEELSDSI